MLHNNPHMTQEMAEYLVCNGWEMTWLAAGPIEFRQGDKKITVAGNTVDFYCYYEAEDDRSAGMFLDCCFGGFSHDITNWIMLMHVAGALPLKQFAANVLQANKPAEIFKRKGYAHVTEMAELILNPERKRA